MVTGLLVGMLLWGTPDVADAGQLRAQMGTRATLVGVIERVAVGQGASQRQGTAVVLDDDTTVYVSYGEPPAGWAPLLGARVRVEGLLSPSLTDHDPSLLAPHLRSVNAPQRDTRPLSTFDGQRVRLGGTARDAKGGAVLLVGKTPVYLPGLDAWPAGAQGQQVVVGGTLVQKQHLPEARRDARGAVSQGASGPQWVLESPQWRLGREPKR